MNGIMAAIGLPAQPVDATHALNLFAGVSNCKGAMSESDPKETWTRGIAGCSTLPGRSEYLTPQW
jgi:hypothetical protein